MNKTKKTGNEIVRNEVFNISENLPTISNLNTLNAYLDIIRFGLFDSIKMVSNCYMQYKDFVTEDFNKQFDNINYLSLKEMHKLITEFDTKIGAVLNSIFEQFENLSKEGVKENEGQTENN